MADQFVKNVKGWEITNYGGGFNLSLHNEDYSVEVDCPDKFGDIIIEHDGCFGRDGCATSRVSVPFDALLEFIIALGYEVKKVS